MAEGGNGSTAAGKAETSSGQEKGKQEKDLTKIDRVVEELKALRDDELFQMDLKDPLCLKAIKYWTTSLDERKEDAQAFAQIQENYKVQQVFQKLKKLQHACRQVPMGVPLKAVLAGEINPLYGVQRPRPKVSPTAASSTKPVPPMEVKSWVDRMLSLSWTRVATWWVLQVAVLLVAWGLYGNRLT